MVTDDSHAADGTILVTGNITPPTCSASGNGAGNNFSVDMPEITTGDFSYAGSSSRTVAYTIRINGGDKCPNGTRVAIYYDPRSPQIAANGNLNLASGSTAGNVQIQILNSKNVPLDLTQSRRSDTVVVTGGSASIGFYARYVATTDSVRAGQAASSVLYILDYL